jgi:hypothetical protein
MNEFSNDLDAHPSMVNESGHRSSETKWSVKLNEFKMPKYDPSVSYEAEFFNKFLENQQLLADVDKVAQENFDSLYRIFRIKDYYDQNVDRLRAERYKSGRRIHERRTMAELERDWECPYKSC